MSMPCIRQTQFGIIENFLTRNSQLPAIFLDIRWRDNNLPYTAEQTMRWCYNNLPYTAEQTMRWCYNNLPYTRRCYNNLPYTAEQTMLISLTAVNFHSMLLHRTVPVTDNESSEVCMVYQHIWRSFQTSLSKRKELCWSPHFCSAYSLLQSVLRKHGGSEITSKTHFLVNLTASDTREISEFHNHAQNLRAQHQSEA